MRTPGMLKRPLQTRSPQDRRSPLFSVVLAAALWVAALCLTGMGAAPLLAQTPGSTAATEGTAKRVEVGDTAPDFSLPDLSGTTHHLADLRGERPVVLVFFRGAW